MKITIILTWFFISGTYCWDEIELQIFDLVEEINENFYQLMNIEQNASLSEIKRAFRTLSITLHPDKSDAEDANIKFRNLVSVYEVLKDPSKREKYNQVLKNGLPNWKSALYYYRRVRKMGLTEMGIILFIIVTIGQYFIAWAAYVEKKYTAEALLGSKLKRIQKKHKSSITIDSFLISIPSPSIKNTLPFQIPRAIWNTPKTVKSFWDAYNEHRKYHNAVLEEKIRERKKLMEIEEELLKEREMRKEGLRKRKEKFAAKEKTDEELKGYTKLNLEKIPKGSIKAVTSSKPEQSGGFWSDEDLIELIRLVKKYPSGSASRWDTIADTMSRTVHEVTFMAAKLKENGYRIPGHTDSVAENIVHEAAKKIKTRKIDNQNLVPETNWTQEEQQLFELAIVKYPKTVATDRWQKIANSVPGKTKEECLARYRYLAEIVKKQKQQKSTETIEKDTVVNSSPISQVNETEGLNVPSTNLSETKEKEQTDSNHENDNDIEVNKATQQTGKPKNKRKERKKQIDSYYDYVEENDFSN